MKKIQLHGKYSHLFALVDDQDYEEVNQFKWYGHEYACDVIYAETNCYHGKKRMRMSMHRLILGLEFGDLRISDHENHNGLDNQRSNLRITTNQRNHFNRRSIRNTSSKFKGVSKYTRNEKWLAQIAKNGRKIFIGHFDNEVKAAKAYDEKALELFGEFANLNFEV